MNVQRSAYCLQAISVPIAGNYLRNYTSIEIAHKPHKFQRRKSDSTPTGRLIILNNNKSSFHSMHAQMQSYRNENERRVDLSLKSL